MFGCLWLSLLFDIVWFPAIHSVCQMALISKCATGTNPQWYRTAAVNHIICAHFCLFRIWYNMWCKIKYIICKFNWYCKILLSSYYSSSSYKKFVSNNAHPSPCTSSCLCFGRRVLLRRTTAPLSVGGFSVKFRLSPSCVKGNDVTTLCEFFCDPIYSDMMWNVIHCNSVLKKHRSKCKIGMWHRLCKVAE
jgi:hypothetical protein